MWALIICSIAKRPSAVSPRGLHCRPDGYVGMPCAAIFFVAGKNFDSATSTLVGSDTTGTPRSWPGQAAVLK